MSLLPDWLSLLSQRERGPRAGEAEAMAQRSRLAPFLPWRAHDPETSCYYNCDDTLGWLLECTPLAFIGSKGLDSLVSLIGQDYPRGTVIQFSLYTDDHIRPLLDEYVALKTRDDPLCRQAAQRYADHLEQGAEGLAAFDGTPIRRFRLFVAIKAPGPAGLAPEQLAACIESLAQAGLAPRHLPPGPLLELLRRIFNEAVPAASAGNYDELRPIAEQVRMADSDFRVDLDQGLLKIGNHYCGCLTPMTPPGEVDSLRMNQLIGGYRGRQDDGTQLTQRFLWTTSVFFDVSREAINRKANLLTAQRAGGSIAKAIGIRVREVDWVMDDMEDQRYVNVITALWVMGRSEDDLRQGIARARNLWEGQDFVMQREQQIAEAMFIAALPFGLYTRGKNIETLNRDLQMSAEAAARFLPVQGDVSSFSQPILLYPGRKGGLVALDLFDANSNNHNFLVVAESGAGKSFQSNFIVNNYYGSGAKIRIVDIGYSYQKQAGICRGRFVDIGEAARGLVINPFDGVHSDGSEEQLANLGMTANVLLSMVYSSTGVGEVGEVQYSLAKDAARFALERDGGERGVDHVAEYLATYPKHAPEGQSLSRAADIAHEMAFNLRDFTTAGVYGRMFNGRSTLNVDSDDFVVLELEQLLNDRELFRVVAVSVINAMTQSLYLSDRRTPTIILFDEAWKYFNSSPVIADVIEEGYRRARKYRGSMGTITQSPLDLEAFGRAGQVVRNNSNYKFMLQSGDYAAAARKGVLDAEGLKLTLLRSVRNNSPRYSETLVEMPGSAGVLRLSTDAYSYWMNTSSGSDHAEFRRVLPQFGGDVDRAIRHLCGESVEPANQTAAPVVLPQVA